jgi:serine/threonine protein kinase
MQEQSSDDQTSLNDPLIGVSVLGYVLTRRIGLGGMGVVYEAQEPNIGRGAAVKVLLPEIAKDKVLVERLVSEARAANAIGDRGIVDIFGFATLPDKRQCIVMELLKGRSLEDELASLGKKQQLMPLGQVYSILDGVAASLKAAHAAGVVHRDLKPSNIFLCRQADGTAFTKLLDFGIAKLEAKTGSHSPKTATNLLMGTPGYMSPEQARGEAAAPSMDLYSLGVIAFEMLTGRVPFDSENVVVALMAHQHEPPPAPSSLTPVNAASEALVLKLLEKKAKDRFLSAGELRDCIRKDLAALTAPPHGLPLQRIPSVKTTRATPIALERTAISTRIEVPRQKRWPWLVVPLLLLPLLGLLWYANSDNVKSGDAVTNNDTAPTAEPSSEAQAKATVPVDSAPPTVSPVSPTGSDTTAPTPSANANVSAHPTEKTGNPGHAAQVAPEPVSQKKKEPSGKSLSPFEEARRRADTAALKLQNRLTRAASRGESVELEQQQLDSVKNSLKKAKDLATVERLETVLDRLSQSQ